MFRNETLPIGLALLLTTLAAPFVRAQNANAHITGRVVDATNLVLPDASIVVIDTERRTERQVYSNESGYFRVPFLNAGVYRVVVSKEGFRPVDLPGVVLEVGQVARLDFVLQVGAIVETITVAIDTLQIASETTEVGQVIDEERIVEMPLNGRNYLALAHLATGVLPANQLGRGARSGERGGFTSVGVHAAQNNVLLDGNDNSSRTSGGPLGYEAQAVTPPVDALSEFKVVTNNHSAEYGYRTGAKVLVSTKSGTNNWHGSLYEFFRNDKLDGTNFFANRSGAGKPAYRRNQFGGTLGGPIVKNKTFFFASYQGTRISLGETSISTVPSAALLAGDTSLQPGDRRDIFDPLSISGEGADAVRQPFPGNRVPRERWDPVAVNVLGLYPAPNIAGRDNNVNNFHYSAARTDSADQYDFRVDHNVGRVHRLFVRYSVRDQNRFDPGPLPLPADGGLGTETLLNGDNLSVNFTSSATPSLSNEVRFGYSYLPTRFDIPFRENWNEILGIRGAPGDSFGDGLDHGYSLFIPSGYSKVGPRAFWPNHNTLSNFLAADTVAWQKAEHSVKFGFELRRARIYREASRFRRGQFLFNGVYTAQQPELGSSRAATGNAIADMLMGFANREVFGNQQGETLEVPYYGFFIQDDWKITSRLTANIGLRYELFLRPSFPNYQDETIGRWLIPEYNGVLPGEERMAFPSSAGDRGGRTDWNNFAPRLGLAYRLASQTVIRAGGGIYYGEDDSLSSESANFRSGPPGHVEIRNDAPRTDPAIRIRDGFSAFMTGIIPHNTSVSVFPDYRPTLYSAQWFADIQHALRWNTVLSIGYNGQASSHLSVRRNINTPRTPHPTVRWFDRKVRPQFDTVRLTEASLNSSYQSLTVKAEKRFSRGLTFLSSFTWSHNIDYDEEDLFVGGAGRASHYELWRDRASSSLDRRFAWISSVIYELPFGQGGRWLQSGIAGRILGGWRLGSIISVLSGLPLNHRFNVDNQNNGGEVRGDWLRQPNLPAGERSVDHWFDTGFVVPGAPGVISNAGRNLIIGPPRNNWDLIVSRQIALPWESHTLQIRFEAFNFTNTPHFGAPDTRVGTADAGRITRADEPRRVQFGLKYAF